MKKMGEEGWRLVASGGEVWLKSAINGLISLVRKTKSTAGRWRCFSV
jgi:hypothetical protein